ncbi:MAG: hypothetical protein HPY61_08175 [Methanotrichaceae archaeon]|nr:hypothetical protein [Methanotrichaceae archaeon]
MIGVCPNCGKPFNIEKKGDEWSYCSDVCIDPASMPTGTRLLSDQATKVYVDGNMSELTREEYIKRHGFDPEPVMQAVDKWREDQIRKWARSFQSKDEVDAWIRRLTAR